MALTFLMLDMLEKASVKNTLAYYLQALIMNKNYICTDISHVKHAYKASVKNTLAYYRGALITSKTIFGTEISSLLDLP